MENSKLTKDIIYVTSEERAYNYKWEKTANKLNPNVQIVSVDDIYEMGVNIFDGKKVPVLDTILIKHPFIPNKYIPLETTEDVITKAKFRSLGIIAHYLGAKEYETTFAITESKERIINANGELDYKLLNAASSVRIKENDSMTGKYYRHETFRGEFSMASYNQAVLEAKQSGLYDDDDINYLLKTRDPKFGNQITSQHVRFNLTKELNSQLDIAFSLKVSSIFKLSANYNQIVSNKQDILIETKLIFE